jgi:hypothetical protein
LDHGRDWSWQIWQGGLDVFLWDRNHSFRLLRRGAIPLQSWKSFKAGQDSDGHQLFAGGPTEDSADTIDPGIDSGSG